jgi:hypothetical protein
MVKFIHTRRIRPFMETQLFYTLYFMQSIAFRHFLKMSSNSILKLWFEFSSSWCLQSQIRSDTWIICQYLLFCDESQNETLAKVDVDFALFSFVNQMLLIYKLDIEVVFWRALNLCWFCPPLRLCFAERNKYDCGYVTHRHRLTTYLWNWRVLTACFVGYFHHMIVFFFYNYTIFTVDCFKRKFRSIFG